MIGEMTRGIGDMTETQKGGTGPAHQRDRERSMGHVMRCLGDIQPLFLFVSLDYWYLTRQARDSRGDSLPRSGELDSVVKMNAATEALEAKEKQKPSFELSGKLAEETNKVRGVALIFTEPPEARKPDTRWRLYVFKGGDVLNEPLYVHRQSCYLFGRERRVADIPTDHPSCSKQHAVLQYRLIEKEQPDGMMVNEVRPYLMDLESTNGTFVNDNRLEPRRYYELMEKDTIRFGNSSREYVLLHENSAQ
ncbi:FHA domain-containing protein DDL-like isoform X2 [Carex rostrata]